MVAVALGGQGHYAAAAAELGRLMADPQVPAGVAAHAAITRGAHRRQLGGHSAARRDDALGLRLAAAAPAACPDADGTDPRAARIDALVGLAADAVGLADPVGARLLLDAADAASRGHPSWRLPVRIAWVRAELALVRGLARDAPGPARRAIEGSLAAGSLRHVVKSRIVLAVALAAAGQLRPAETVDELDAVAAECARLGLLPLAWPCRTAAADVVERETTTGLGCVQDHPPCTDGANDPVARTAQPSPNDTTSDPARRRHAALATLSVIALRTDPVGRRLMGESVWVPRPPQVT